LLERASRLRAPDEKEAAKQIFEEREKKKLHARQFEDLTKDLADELELRSGRKARKRWFKVNLPARSWVSTHYMALSYGALKALNAVSICIQLLVMDYLIAVDGEHYIRWTLNDWTNGYWIGKANRKELYPLLAFCRVISYGGESGNLGKHRVDNIPCNLNVNLWHKVFFTWFL
jgi:hypothetical protein